jgi:hypothetical protein
VGLKIECGFKPDIFTELGIGSKNDWRLPPTIYSRDEVKSGFPAYPDSFFGSWSRLGKLASQEERRIEQEEKVQQ